MTGTAVHLRRLAHDVGKYVARTARNLPAGEAPRVLVDMLARDLYALDRERPASAVFEERVAPLANVLDAAGLARCREHLAAIDALRDAVERADPDAVRRAAEHAVAVSAAVGELVRGAGPR